MIILYGNVILFHEYISIDIFTIIISLNPTKTTVNKTYYINLSIIIAIQLNINTFKPVGILIINNAVL